MLEKTGQIDQGVGYVRVAGKAVGQLPAQVNRFLQIRPHGREIMGRSRLHPRGIGSGRVRRPLGHQPGRDLSRLLILPAGGAEEGGFVAVVRVFGFERP